MSESFSEKYEKELADLRRYKFFWFDQKLNLLGYSWMIATHNRLFNHHPDYLDLLQLLERQVQFKELNKNHFKFHFQQDSDNLFYINMVLFENMTELQVLSLTNVLKESDVWYVDLFRSQFLTKDLFVGRIVKRYDGL